MEYMYTDRPIERCSDDVFGRADFARMIGDILISTRPGESLCIGLMGPWGSGKTSVIKMTEEYLNLEERKPNISICWFSPWNFSTTEQLISQFFLQLAEFFNADEAKKEKIGKAIKKYANVLDTSVLSTVISLAAPVGNLISSLMKKGIEEAGKFFENSAFQNKSVQKQKDDLEKLLRECEEKIVIVIDDIDRLTDDQIRCVFQLVTTICRFPNISYLLAFDRAVVSKALDKIQESRGEEFLEKVIQVPLSVPGIRKEKLFSIMAYHLNELTGIYAIKAEDEEKWSQLYEFCVSRLIKTYREILRLSNSLRSKLPLLSKDVDFEDLVIITLIEQHEPQLYEWIRQHREILTGQLSYENIRDLGDSEQDKQNRKKRYQEEIGQIIFHGKEYSVNCAIETLSILFPAFSSKTGGYNYYDDKRLREDNCIGHPLKFDRYFTLSINEDQISSSDLQYLMNEAPEEETASIITERDIKQASIELFDEIRVRIGSLGTERTKILILGLQAIGDSLKAESSNGLFMRTASGEARDLINELLIHLNPEDRFSALEEMIPRICESNINLTSSVLNNVYIAHGRLFDGEEKRINKDYPELSSDDHLALLEEKYLAKVKEILGKMNAFTMMDKGWFMHFYKHFPAGKDFLIRTITSESESIIYYLYRTSSLWHRTGRKTVDEIEITGKYKDLVTDDQIRQAIQDCISQNRLPDLPKDQQRVIAAYLMKEEKSAEYPGNILVYEIDKKLEELNKQR